MHRKILKMLFYQITFFILIAVIVASYFKFYGVDVALGPYFIWFVAVDIALGMGIFGWAVLDEIKKKRPVKKTGRK